MDRNHPDSADDVARALGGTKPGWTLGDRLTKARSVAGLTQEQIAQRLGIGTRSVVRAESDETTPNRAVLIGWAAITAVSLDWLERGDATSAVAS